MHKLTFFARPEDVSGDLFSNIHLPAFAQSGAARIVSALHLMSHAINDKHMHPHSLTHIVPFMLSLGQTLITNSSNSLESVLPLTRTFKA